MVVDPARQVAYDALRAVDAQDAYLNLALRGLLAEANLAGRDAAFATELASGTARMTGTYDLLIDHLLDDGTAGLQPEVRTALRLGAHQLLNMRVAAHAAVGTTVELVRTAVGERPVRLVNAVLRKLAADSYDTWVGRVTPADSDPIRRLAIRHAHPEWVVAAFRDALAAARRPEDELAALLAANNQPADVALAVRPGLAEVAELVDGETRRPGRWSPYAVGLDGGDPSALPQVRAGTVGVQDEGSQLATLMLARAEVAGAERRWLDMCAGPGGKAALLTGLAAERGVTLVANELRTHRGRLVQQALRAYPSPSPVVVADALRPPWGTASFDRVLVDAPCTGLGALRRRAEARWRRREADLDALVWRQLRLLDAALGAVRPGGVVGYVTCSPHLRETREVVDALVTGNPGSVVEVDARTLLPEVADRGPGPHVQLWPHLHGTDAMFVAVLRRQP